MSMIVKLLREPLLHFVIAGALLFGLYTLVSNGSSEQQQDAPVRIGAGEVLWLSQTFSNQWKRDPTREELNALLATLQEEELMAREARAIGLDQNDTIVRRRLAQKLSFSVAETSRIADPTEEELRRFFATHIERYRPEARVSFEQVYFSPARRQRAEADAAAVLKKIATVEGDHGSPAEGDPLLIESTFHDVELRAVSGLFGSEFARAVFAMPTGAVEWSCNICLRRSPR